MLLTLTFQDTEMEDDEVQKAIAMSMGQELDTNAMSDILGSLPGVNTNDPRIQNALREDEKAKQQKKKDQEGKK